MHLALLSTWCCTVPKWSVLAVAFKFDPRDLFECPLTYSTCTWEFSLMYPEILDVIACFYYIARFNVWVDDLVKNDPLNRVFHRFTVQDAEVAPAQPRGHFCRWGRTGEWGIISVFALFTEFIFRGLHTINRKPYSSAGQPIGFTFHTWKSPSGLFFTRTYSAYFSPTL